ncbi:MAG: hypothetical protein MUC88_00090 [Planctomycetes bacterium]|jgi:hypothetical protein|nr:hypothetical protein [Planctomycetota bacterium]
MRVQHRVRRRGANDPGLILVGGARYVIDEIGQVDVSDEHAAMMLQGSGWVQVKQAVRPPPAPTPAPAAPDVERERLLARAETLGIKLDRRLSTNKIAAAVEAEEEKRK